MSDGSNLVCNHAQHVVNPGAVVRTITQYIFTPQFLKGNGMGLAAVVLAAGGGTRMNSSTPKILHRIGGVPMIRHVLDTVRELEPDRTVVVAGQQWRRVADAVSEFAPEAEIAVQPRRLGTANAVAETRNSLAEFNGTVMVLYGDTPYVKCPTLRALVRSMDGDTDVNMLGFRSRNPAGYGRMILNTRNELEQIVEEADATEEELLVDLCNSGIVCAQAATLFRLIGAVGNDNAAGEYYLTDIVKIANVAGLRCRATEGDESELIGVNSRAELAQAEALFQETARSEAFKQGATLVASESIYFGYGCSLGQDVTIEPHVVIGPDVEIENGAVVRSFSHLENCRIGKDAIVGPYARIRPDTQIGNAARVGNFVEVKASTLGKGCKVPHLSYIGDTEVGERTNVGAGTITCNYDGVSKHQTRIGKEAFVGSNSTIVAPVEISDRAITAAGSVITADVPSEALAVARKRQKNLAGAADRLMKRLKGQDGAGGGSKPDQPGELDPKSDVAKGGR